ncbi:MAG: hypothetical protein KBS70_07580, partial [Bacteroidales bacterium]|nr:hypothetical protein [Candidatus Colicola equi]
IAASFRKGGASGHTEIITEYWDVDFYLKYDIITILQEYLKSHPNNRKVLNLIETIKNDPEYLGANKMKEQK